jgi:hypothetical protein
MRVVTTCETSEENRPAAFDVTFRDDIKMTRNTHRRGRVQESGRMRWILSSEMGLVLVLGSSTWM